MAIVFLVGLYRWTSNLAPEAAPLLTGLTLVNVTFWIYYRRTLSELAFVTVMIWTVNALNRALVGRYANERGLYALIGCVLAIYLSMIREAGALFVVAFVLASGTSVINGRQKLRDGMAVAIIVAVPTLLAIIVFVAYDQSTFEGSRSLFGTHLSGFLHRHQALRQQILEGLRLQISAIGRLIVPGMFKAYGHSWLNINTAVYVFVTAGVLIGWSRILQHEVELFAYVLPLYIILYAAWGFDADTRYMLPMLPILVVSLWKLVEPYRLWRLSALTALLILQAAVAIGYWIAVEIPQGLECNRQWPKVNRIVGVIQSEPGPVATAGKIPECVREMLTFALDRPVPNIHPKGTTLESLAWVVVPLNYPAPSGFHEIAEASSFRVLRNAQPTPVGK
jgi:hypothetical protein